MSQDINNFSFKMFQNWRSLRSSKCFKTTVELTFATQKANACSPWTACSVFDWEYIFWVNLVQKTQTYQLKLEICTQTNSNMQNSMVMFNFLFSTGNTSLGKFGPKIQNGQFELKFGTKINFNLNMRNSVMMLPYSVFDWK